MRKKLKFILASIALATVLSAFIVGYASIKTEHVYVDLSSRRTELSEEEKRAFYEDALEKASKGIGPPDVEVIHLPSGTELTVVHRDSYEIRIEGAP